MSSCLPWLYFSLCRSFSKELIVCSISSAEMENRTSSDVSSLDPERGTLALSGGSLEGSDVRSEEKEGESSRSAFQVEVEAVTMSRVIVPRKRDCWAPL